MLKVAPVCHPSVPSALPCPLSSSWRFASSPTVSRRSPRLPPPASISESSISLAPPRSAMCASLSDAHIAERGGARLIDDSEIDAGGGSRGDRLETVGEEAKRQEEERGQGSAEGTEGWHTGATFSI